MFVGTGRTSRPTPLKVVTASATLDGETTTNDDDDRSGAETLLGGGGRTCGMDGAADWRLPTDWIIDVIVLGRKETSCIIIML